MNFFLKIMLFFIPLVTISTVSLVSCKDEYMNENMNPTEDNNSDIDSILAFPGAQGFGRYASGGRGGIIVYVTNLNNDGEGSLRWAVEELSGPRMVLFKTGGIIQLKGRISVVNGNVTIAGQTAPGDGITLKGAGLVIRDNNVIVRGLRIRPGDGPGEKYQTRDCITTGKNGQLVKNVMIDHNSLTWSVDENVNTWYESDSMTFSNNIIAEGLFYSIHGATINKNKPHSMGFLAGPHSEKISLYRNLFAHNWRRNPRVLAEEVEVVNNYIYNYDSGAMIRKSTHREEDTTSSHFINNYFDAPRDDMEGSSAIVKLDAGKIYINGNLSKQLRPDYSIDEMELAGGKSEDYVSNVIFESAIDNEAILPAEDVLASIKDNVGACWPQRDLVDTRIVYETVNRTNQGRSGMKNNPSEAGGYPTVQMGEAPQDSDVDGIPDKYEVHFGGDPHTRDGTIKTENGYTRLENYLNAIITGDLP